MIIFISLHIERPIEIPGGIQSEKSESQEDSEPRRDMKSINAADVLKNFKRLFKLGWNGSPDRKVGPEVYPKNSEFL